MNKARKPWVKWLAAAVLTLSLSGCGLFPPTQEDPTPGIVVPTARVTLEPPAVDTLAPTATLQPGPRPTEPAVPSPTLPAPATIVSTATSPPPPPTATAVPPTTIPPTETRPAPTATSSTQRVNIYLIALEDSGRSGPAIGCGDSVVPVEIIIPRTRGILRAALNNLLAIDEAYYGQSGLYNALHQSDLTLADVTIVDREARIFLEGTLFLSGVCDNPRVEAQLEQIALQFSTVDSVAVFVNGEPLKEVLSLRGE